MAPKGSKGKSKMPRLHASSRSERGEASNPPTQPLDYDPTRFRDRKYSDRFDNLDEVKIIRERKFDLKEGEFEEIKERIAEFGWETFCYDQNTFSPTVVKEFYANGFKFENDDRWERNASWVRGHSVYYSPNNINGILGISHRPTDCNYSAIMRDRHNKAQDIIEALCKEGSTWEINKRGLESHFSKSHMHPIPKIWCSFVQNNILPTSNTSEVTIERAVLVYMIVMGEKFNIGSVIGYNLFKMIQKDRPTVGYPCLITRLCERDRVPIPEPYLRPDPPLTLSSIRQLIRGRAPYEPIAPPPPQVMTSFPSRPRASASSSSAQPNLMQAVADLQTSVNNLTSLVNQAVVSQAEHRQMQEQHNLAVQQALTDIAVSVGVQTTHWSFPVRDPTEDINFDPDANRDISGDEDIGQDDEEDDDVMDDDSEDAN